MDQYHMNQNSAEELAEQILLIENNNFLSSAEIELNHSKAYMPSFNDWIRIDGYRAGHDRSSTLQKLKVASGEWFRSGLNQNHVVGAVLVKKDGINSLYYGSESIGNKNYFLNNLPELKYTKESPDNITSSYNGIVVGSINGDLAMEVLMNCDINNGYAAVVICPYSSDEIRNRINQIQNQIAFLSQYKSITRIYGSSTRRVEESSNQIISDAINTLQESLDFLTKNRGSNLCQAIIKTGAESRSDLQIFLDGVAAAISHNGQGKAEELRMLEFTKEERYWREHLSVPYVEFDAKGLNLLSIQSLDSITDWCLPPVNSHKGFFVKEYQINEDSIRIFSSDKKKTGNGLLIGKNEDQENVYLPINLMTCHTGVFGASGGGKTTTVKRVLVDVSEENIPFLVIEAAKKEYHRLNAFIKDLNVYTAGSNGRLLQINPLEPEDGTLIENQVDMLVRAIVAAHGNEHPIPEGLEGIIKLSYEKRGWHYGMLAYQDDRRPFPTMSDVYENIDEYIDNHARYGEEVRQNLTAALKIRTESISSGALGRVCGESHGITAANLLSSATVIELDDFSESVTVFLMNVIMFKIQSYLSSVRESRDLCRLIVVEEAHNVFRKNENNSAEQEVNNQYFDKMLSVIRASGTGLIICDQRPSIMLESVVANTAIKLVHGMEEKKDREVIARSLDFTEIQTRKLRELSPGECIMSLRGQFGSEQVTINELPFSSTLNAYCCMCNRTFNCHRNFINNALQQNNKTDYYITKIMSNPYDQAFVGRIANCLAEDCQAVKKSEKCCLLAEALRSFGSVPEELQRIITTGYHNYLQGEN